MQAFVLHIQCEDKHNIYRLLKDLEVQGHSSACTAEFDVEEKWEGKGLAASNRFAIMRLCSL